MEKKKKKILIGTIVGVGLTALCIGVYKYLDCQINKEGSSLWFKYASLDELKKFREKIGEQFRNAGINNITDEEYNYIEHLKFKLDNRIGTIENVIFNSKHPNACLPRREHGWYLSNDD